jgi:hypothetical protein
MPRYVSTEKAVRSFHKFTKPTIKKVFDRLREYIPQSLACESAGISQRTFEFWLEKGRADRDSGLENEHTQLVIDYTNLVCDNVRTQIAQITYGEKGWQARAWLLERLYRIFFGLDGPEIAKLREEIEEAKQLIAMRNAETMKRTKKRK